MNIMFEKFTEKHINEAVNLALCELEEEKKHCYDLPEDNFFEKITGILQWLSGQPFGKAAICDGKLVGDLLFAGIKTVIIPYDNVADLDEVDSCVKDAISFMPVKSVAAVDVALGVLRAAAARVRKRRNKSKNKERGFCFHGILQRMAPPGRSPSDES